MKNAKCIELEITAVSTNGLFTRYMIMISLLGGGAVRGSEGHPAATDNMASEKGHLLAKRALFPTITRGAAAPPAPPARYGPAW